MTSTLKIKNLLLTTAVLCGLTQAGFAANIQLDQLETELGDSKIKIELWGDQLNNGYADQLMIFF